MIKTSNSKRLFELDVLRGMAALSVLLYHYTSRYDELYGHSPELLIYFPYGEYGVSLFFIISGFVIFMTLDKTRRSLDFLVGRFSRLYPAYWTAIVLTFVIVNLIGLPGRETGLVHAIFNFTMLQSFFNIPDVDWVYWTLQVELCFYLIMFALYKLKLLKRFGAIALFWLIAMLVTYGIEKYTPLVIPELIKTCLLLNYANLFILGMVLFKVKQTGFSLKKCLIIFACLAIHPFVTSWFSTYIIAGFVLTIGLAIQGWLQFICWQPLIFLGTISYSLYLTHQNIGYVVIRSLSRLGINSNTSVFIAIVVAIALAAAITTLVEQPALHYIRDQYRRRFLKVAARQP